MVSITVPGAIVAAGAVSAGASVIGSSNAASAQRDAANQANQTQLSIFNKTQQNLAPFIGGGGAAVNPLQVLTGTNAAQPGTLPPAPAWATSTDVAGASGLKTAYNALLGRDPSATDISNLSPTATMQDLYKAITSVPGSDTEYSNLLQAGKIPGGTPGIPAGNPLTATLTAPFQPTVAQLEQTPGYQFTKQQGLESAQNSFAARGLGASGAAEKGAATFATGLANSTWLDQLNAHLANNSQIYNMLMGQAQLGENAAAGQGTIGQQTGASIGSNIIGAGNATGAADIAGANAIGGAASGGVNNYLQYNMLSNLLNGGGTASGGSNGSYLNPNLIGGANYSPG